jgi:hypothetical protein
VVGSFFVTVARCAWQSDVTREKAAFLVSEKILREQVLIAATRVVLPPRVCARARGRTDLPARKRAIQRRRSWLTRFGALSMAGPQH